MVTIVFLQWAHQPDGFENQSPVGHEPQMLENAYKSIWCPLPDGVVRFALEVEVYDIEAKTRYFSALGPAAVLRASKVDWCIEDCAGWYDYDYRTAIVRAMPPTNCGCRNFPASKTRALGSGKVSSLIDIKAMFDKREGRNREGVQELREIFRAFAYSC